MDNKEVPNNPPTVDEQTLLLIAAVVRVRESKKAIISKMLWLGAEYKLSASRESRSLPFHRGISLTMKHIMCSSSVGTPENPITQFLQNVSGGLQRMYYVHDPNLGQTFLLTFLCYISHNNGDTNGMTSRLLAHRKGQGPARAGQKLSQVETRNANPNTQLTQLLLLSPLPSFVFFFSDF